MGIVKATANELNEWTNMALLLFPETSFEEELELHKGILAAENEVGLLYEKDGQYIGFMHLCIRTDYVNGTDTSPVVFVEAIFIMPEHRRQGIGRQFIEYAEDYARQRGISQIASDCYIDNYSSEQFHKSCGFIEKERVICFAKNIES